MPFVTLADPDLVGGTADDPACCQDPALLSCGAATILPSALGKQGSIELPNNIVLKYAGHVGGNKRSYSYLGEGGARATITCSQDKHCNGNARSAAGEDYVLEYCGEVGHMWKQPNMEEMRDGEGTGSGCNTHESPGPGPRTSLGNRGKQAVQRRPRRVAALQALAGRAPVMSMNRSSW